MTEQKKDTERLKESHERLKDRTQQDLTENRIALAQEQVHRVYISRDIQDMKNQDMMRQMQMGQMFSALLNSQQSVMHAQQQMFAVQQGNGATLV